MKNKKPIKWAILCWIPVEIYAWDIWQWVLHEATFWDLKSFVYKVPEGVIWNDEEFAHWVNDPGMFKEITKEQYNAYIKNNTKFDVNCNEI